MPTEIRMREPYFDFGDLIDGRIKAYRDHSDVPPITFWGFCQVFYGRLKWDLTNSGGAVDSHEKRLDFLKQIFQNTSVDPWTYIFRAEHAAKTELNQLSALWHLTWKYQKLPLSFERLENAYRKDPELALNGVVHNLKILLQSHAMERDRVELAALELLKKINASCISGSQRPELERVLSVLLLMCLLGEPVVFATQYDVAEWLDRKSKPSGLLMMRGHRHQGLYHIEDAQINTKLLPDIICGDTRYEYRPDSGSPLRQIIQEQQYQWIYLSGRSGPDGDSTGSGVGKTTSLRFLALEEQGSNVLWLPLAEIYDHHNLRDPQLLSHHISMKLKLSLSELPESTLFLFDGLDELISREQLDMLSGDLYMLQHSGKFGLIVSSKLPWEQMPRIDVFYQWSSVWEQFQSCFIQTLAPRQIMDAISKQDGDTAVFRLNTPFLLALYMQTASIPDDPWTQSLIHRWRAERLFHDTTLTEELLFYRSLLVQIIRWYESNQGQKIQWEADAFLLLHTMPAIAFQMYRSEANDPLLDPAAAVQIDEKYVRRMIDVIWRATCAGLDLFPGYSNPRHRQILQGISFERFLSGAVPSLFHGEWDGGHQFANPRFTNFSLRDNLAFLHIANEFLLAYEGALETTAEAIEAYGHTIELVSAKQLQKAVAFFQLIAGRDLKPILRAGPAQNASSSLSRFLAGHIGATLCEHIPEFSRDQSISSGSWYKSMISAFQEMERIESPELQQLIEQKFGLAYIYGQTIYAKNFRLRGEYTLADQCADQVIAFQKKHPNLINSDGYHIKALVLLEQVRLLLNGQSNLAFKPVCACELARAEELIGELDGISSGTLEHSKQFPVLSDAQRRVIPIFSMMLKHARHRWTAYSSRDFYQNSALEFLCSASYLAKYYCILAALSVGNSGMAYNLLGSLAANDTEVLENNPNLPFFKAHPKLHTEISELAYQDRFLAAYQIYFLIYNIRRGPQPYSARRLCEFLLRRQVRLDPDGQPVSACGSEPFTSQEFDFLEQATARALFNRQNNEFYWRARYLHELARQDPEHPQYGQRIKRAEQALQEAWLHISGDQKLQELINFNFQKVDFVSVLVLIEVLLLYPTWKDAQRDVVYERVFRYLAYMRETIS